MRGSGEQRQRVQDELRRGHTDLRRPIPPRRLHPPPQDLVVLVQLHALGRQGRQRKRISFSSRLRASGARYVFVRRLNWLCAVQLRLCPAVGDPLEPRGESADADAAGGTNQSATRNCTPAATPMMGRSPSIIQVVPVAMLALWLFKPKA